jgi:hypothetical protein
MGIRLPHWPRSSARGQAGKGGGVMQKKDKGNAVNVARLENDPISCSKDNIDFPRLDSNGILQFTHLKVAEGDVRQELVSLIDAYRQQGMPEGDKLEFLPIDADSPGTNLLFSFGNIRVKVTVSPWQPIPDIPIQKLTQKIHEINSESCCAEEVAQSLERRGCRTLLTSRNPRELVKDMRDGLERGNKLTWDLVEQLEDVRNWANSIPDSATITLEWWAIAKEAE